MINITIQRRHLYVLAAMVVAAAVIIPTASWAAHTFDDVPDTNIFHDDIEWLANAGVTKGCNPPANTNFCPGDTVTRETMAAFMKRLAEAQVVDAATAVSAENATTLDGYEVGQLVRAYGANGSSATGAGNHDLATLEAEAPVAGIFVISAVADIENWCGTGSGLRGDLNLRVNDTIVMSIQESRDECLSPYDMAYAATAKSSVAVEVPAGTHTIDLDWTATTGELFSNESSITVIFTPFGSAPALASTGGTSTQNP